MGYVHFPHLVQITLLRENVEPIFQTNSGSSSNTSSNTLLSSNSTTFSTSSSSNCQLTINHSTRTFASPSNNSVAVAKDQWGHPLPLIGPKTKIFELSTVNDMAKVCLIYDSSSSNNPKIYLLELSSLKWIFLADNFSEYLRMAIAHLGLPYWELCFASCGLPSWTEVSERVKFLFSIVFLILNTFSFVCLFNCKSNYFYYWLLIYWRKTKTDVIDGSNQLLNILTMSWIPTYSELN